MSEVDDRDGDEVVSEDEIAHESDDTWESVDEVTGPLIEDDD